MTAQDLTETPEGSRLTALNKGELFASFDVDAFEVPGGRDEIWRFTPLRRLRGLHDGSAPATGSAQITVSEPAGRAGGDRAPRRPAAGPGRYSRRSCCGPSIFVVQLGDAGHRRAKHADR